MEHMHIFNQIIDEVQSATTQSINENQKKALYTRYKLQVEFEYGKDEQGRFIIKTSEETLKVLDYYIALKYDKEEMELSVKGKIEGKLYIMIAYNSNSLHLSELFDFLEQHK